MNAHSRVSYKTSNLADGHVMSTYSTHPVVQCSLQECENIYECENFQSNYLFDDVSPICHFVVSANVRPGQDSVFPPKNAIISFCLGS
jgi:hypothetical protein